MTDEEDWRKATGRGLKAAYPTRSHSQGEQTHDKSLYLQHSMSDSSISVSQPTTLRSFFPPGVNRIQIKKQDHTVKKILGGVGLILLVILLIDINSQIHREKHRYELQAKHCYSQYTENQCENPIEALRTKCQELQLCFSTNIGHKIKITSIFASLVGKAVNTCTSSAGLPGSIFLMALICAILFFAYKSGKATMVIKQE